MRKHSRRLLPIPALKGNLHVVAGSEDDEGPAEAVILGDPEGLRSLAAVLYALADFDQNRLADVPLGAMEHLHLDAGSHLRKKSARLVVSRLDDKTGAFPEYYGRRNRKARPIREERLIKNV